MFCAEVCDSFNISCIQRYNATLTLYKLDHDCAHLLVTGLLECLERVCFGIDKAFGEGEEEVVENILAGCSQRRDSASVERVDQCDNPVAAGAIFVKAVFSGDLDCAFICFCARVAEKDLRISRAAAQGIGKLYIRGGIVQVRDMLQSCCLLRHGLYPVGVTEPERIDADAGCKVDVFLAVDIGAAAAASFDGAEVAPSVGIHNPRLIQRLDFFKSHGNISILSRPKIS